MQGAARLARPGCGLRAAAACCALRPPVTLSPRPWNNPQVGNHRALVDEHDQLAQSIAQKRSRRDKLLGGISAIHENVSACVREGGAAGRRCTADAAALCSRPALLATVLCALPVARLCSLLRL